MPPSFSAGATVASPVHRYPRTLDSNVLIKSGNTLAIGGLLQDEATKARTKVPHAWGHPGPRIFVPRETERAHEAQPARLCHADDPRPGLWHRLRRSVSGLHHTGEELRILNGWRNNANRRRASDADFESAECRRLSQTGTRRHLQRAEQQVRLTWPTPKTAST